VLSFIVSKVALSTTWWQPSTRESWGSLRP